MRSVPNTPCWRPLARSASPGRTGMCFESSGRLQSDQRAVTVAMPAPTGLHRSTVQWVHSMRPGQQWMTLTRHHIKLHNQPVSAGSLDGRQTSWPTFPFASCCTITPCSASAPSSHKLRQDKSITMTPSIRPVLGTKPAYRRLTYSPTQAVTSTTPVVPRHVFSIIKSYTIGFVSIASGVSPSPTSMPELRTLQ